MSASMRRKQVQAAYGSLLRAIERGPATGAPRAASAPLHSAPTAVAPPLRHPPQYNVYHSHRTTTCTRTPCHLASALFPRSVQSFYSTSISTHAAGPSLQLRLHVCGQSVGGSNASCCGTMAPARHIGIRSFASSSPSSGKSSGSEDEEARKKKLLQELLIQRLAREKRRSQGSQEWMLYAAAIVALMLGLTYAAVPLYRLFCQATGYGGTTQRSSQEAFEDKLSNLKDIPKEKLRQIRVTFNSDVAPGLRWRFKPCQKEVKLVPGKSVLAFYNAKNLSDEALVGVSTYNVSPMKAGSYFSKIQCFCFEEQRLLPNEDIDMPVFFYIDPEFLMDPKMDDVHTITLSYTFFESSMAPPELIQQLQGIGAPHLSRLQQQ